MHSIDDRKKDRPGSRRNLHNRGSAGRKTNPKGGNSKGKTQGPTVVIKKGKNISYRDVERDFSYFISRNPTLGSKTGAGTLAKERGVWRGLNDPSRRS